MLDALKSVVQHNCHISDARHAGDYTMCVYLLKMREYFRWEQGYSFEDSLPGEAVGEWLRDREALWEQLETQTFSSIPMGERTIDPFDSDTANEVLADHELIYSGGIGIKQKPLFFLADLEREEHCGDYRILISAREHARDLAAPPAMSRDNTIYIRRESLRRFIWERIEEWKWNRPDNAMGRAIRCYDFENDPVRSLDAITDNEVESVLLHEIGEIRAGELLGHEWEKMLNDLPRSHAEIMLRAVRDHLADALSTLPKLLDDMKPAQIHFYFSNLSGMRKKIYPEILEAYNVWLDTGSPYTLHSVEKQGTERWTAVAERALICYREHGANSAAHIEQLVTDSIQPS